MSYLERGPWIPREREPNEYIPQGHVPLSRAALCLSCRTVFYLGPTCPSCAGESFMTLARILDRETSGRHCRACGQALVPKSLRADETPREFQARFTCNRRCRDVYRLMVSRSVWTITRRFWSQVEKTPTCWLWTGAKSDTGYGSVQVLGKRWNAHKLSAWFAGKVPPPGHELCHTCDVRHCVNPDHLFIGTRADNVADMVQKGRNRWGERHPSAKLTASEVEEIRARVEAGETQRSVAALYGISNSHVNGIAKRRFWKQETAQ